MKRMATDCGTFLHLRDGVSEEDAQSDISRAHRLMDAINDLHDELGRPPTNAELEARMERRKTPRPTELTYELDEAA